MTLWYNSPKDNSPFALLGNDHKEESMPKLSYKEAVYSIDSSEDYGVIYGLLEHVTNIRQSQVSDFVWTPQLSALKITIRPYTGYGGKKKEPTIREKWLHTELQAIQSKFWKGVIDFANPTSTFEALINGHDSFGKTIPEETLKYLKGAILSIDLIDKLSFEIPQDKSNTNGGYTKKGYSAETLSQRIETRMLVLKRLSGLPESETVVLSDLMDKFNELEVAFPGTLSLVEKIIS